MSNQLALHEAHNALSHMEDRFNALAVVAGRAMPKVYDHRARLPLTVAVAAGSAAAQAKWGRQGAIANGVVAVLAYMGGMLAGDNADLREVAYTVGIGCGASAASILTYDKVTNMIAKTTAPAPTAAAA